MTPHTNWEDMTRAELEALGIELERPCPKCPRALYRWLPHDYFRHPLSGYFDEAGKRQSCNYQEDADGNEIPTIDLSDVEW